MIALFTGVARALRVDLQNHVMLVGIDETVGGQSGIIDGCFDCALSLADTSVTTNDDSEETVTAHDASQFEIIVDAILHFDRAGGDQYSKTFYIP
jgi:hypothetical protein